MPQQVRKASGSGIVGNEHTEQANANPKMPTVLVAVDFSHCSRLALRMAKSWAAGSGGKVLVLHVIDEDFVRKCVHHHLGSEGEIKQKLFLSCKKKLRDFVHGEGMDEMQVEEMVCAGSPCMEINRKALESGVEMIIMGSRGNSGDIKTIFFGSTTERVLRFIKRPVLCVPPGYDYNLT